MKMEISLPFSKDKRYLTGIDWVIHTIDYVSKKITGVGNVSQIVLELNGSLSPEDFKEQLANFIKDYPIINGKPARDYNLAPYWKFCPTTAIPPKLNSYEYSKDTDRPQIISILAQEVNRPFDDSRQHVMFHLACLKDKSFIAMTFDHRLLDARGAEAFLGLFQQRYKGRGNDFKSVFPKESAHLCQWRKKFEAGKRVNRTFLHLAKNNPPALPLPSVSKKIFQFKVISFDKTQTSRIVERAYDQAGYLMLMPYALAITVRALHSIFTQRRIQTGDYVVPVSIDRRPSEDVQEEIFFNHVSFFIFQISPKIVNHFPDLLATIKNQMYNQVKMGLLRDFEQASLLMRILPLPVLARLMHLPLRGQIASFCFSYVGETAYNFSEFLQKRVNNLFHMPRPPIPPGLGIFFNQFQGKLNATLSYIEGILTESEVTTIVQNIESSLEIE